MGIGKIERILGIDQSLNSTGVVILEGNEVLHEEVIEFASDVKDRVDKMVIMKARLLEIYNEFKPDVVGREGFSFGSFGNVKFLMGALGFTIDILFRELGITTHVVPPKTVKKFITDNGNAKKEEMIAVVEMKYNFKTTDDNIADAFGIAKYIQNELT